jgi:hypothetical protein
MASFLAAFQSSSSSPAFKFARDSSSQLYHCVGLIVILFVGWSSDRTKERVWHTALPIAAASAGLPLAGYGEIGFALSVAMFLLPQRESCLSSGFGLYRRASSAVQRRGFDWLD